MRRLTGIAAVIIALVAVAIVAVGNHGLAGTILAVAFALAFLGIALSLAVGLLGALSSNDEEEDDGEE